MTHREGDAMLPTAWVVAWTLDEQWVICRFDAAGNPSRDGRDVYLRPIPVNGWWHVEHQGRRYRTGNDY